jgi:hypothetical protein
MSERLTIDVPKWNFEIPEWAPEDPRWREYYDSRHYYEGPLPTTTNTEPLPESFGRELDTLEKAWQWLTNPHNWHESRVYIIKWTGLVCTVTREHGERLIREPWDWGLPLAVVTTQRLRRSKNLKGEPMDEPEAVPGDV